MDCCNVYINEKSFNSQNSDVASVEKTVVSLLECLSVLDGCNPNAVRIHKYFSRLLYTAPLSHDLCIQNLGNKDLKRKFKLALRGAVSWEDSPLSQAGAVYLHKGLDVSWSSMSESYENTFPLLANLNRSDVDEPLALIEKKGDGSVKVASCSDASVVIREVIKRGWRQQTYNYDSSVPPRDEESILADANKFDATEHRYNGRQMYRRKGTNNLCYIDSKHFGGAAHIEEFNEITKKPVQTLKINDDSVHHELTYNEKRRTLRFDNE